MTEPTDTPPAPDVDAAGIVEVAEGVWVIPDRRVPLVPNVGIVLGDDVALVVDTGLGPLNGARVLEAAREVAGRRRLLLTLTHFHPEHAYGAQAFRDDARSIVNGAQAAELDSKGSAYLEMFRTFGPDVAAALEGVELTPADETYDGSTRIDLGGRAVRLQEFGRAHTAGDQVAIVEDAGVLFTGDLVEESCFPIFPFFPPDDTDVDASAWIHVLGRLEELAPDVVVPGHGALGGVSVISIQRGFMEQMRTETYALADDGRSADDAVAELEPRLRALHPDWAQPEWVDFGIRCFHAERAG